jgi:hypothetical protein
MTPAGPPMLYHWPRQPQKGSARYSIFMISVHEVRYARAMHRDHGKGGERVEQQAGEGRQAA